MTPSIVSVWYSLELTEETYKKCWVVDLCNLKNGGNSLEKKLKNLNPCVVKADYVFIPCKMLIKFKTDCIKNVDPKHNSKLWQKIADTINKHIGE